MDDGDNPSIRNDNWLHNRFDLWKREFGLVDSKEIEDYTIEELANLMTQFFLALCKDSGDLYPSGSIGNLYNSLNRILRGAQKKRIRLTKVDEAEFKLRKKYVKFTERRSKNHRAIVTKNQPEQFRRPVYSYNEDVVKCWEAYDSHLDIDMKNGVFFLGPLDEPRTTVWYKRTNVGIGSLRKWVANMAHNAGISRDITNKSGRAPAISRMSMVGVPKSVTCGVTGHKNPNMLDRYDHSLDIAHELPKGRLEILTMENEL